jgi:hypothetical protein
MKFDNALRNICRMQMYNPQELPPISHSVKHVKVHSKLGIVYLFVRLFDDAVSSSDSVVSDVRMTSE